MAELKEQLNAKVIAAFLAFVVVAGGFFFYKKQYTPAKLALTTAQGSEQQAQSTLTADQATLSNTHKKGPDNSQFGAAMLAQEAIPQDPQIAEAMLDAQTIAAASGVTMQTLVPAASTDSSTDATDGTTGASGPNASQMTITGYGTYPDMLVYLQKLQESVQPMGTGTDQKVYITGREFNVASFQVQAPDPTGTAAGTDGSVTGDGTAAAKIPKGDLNFTIAVTMYSHNSSDAAAAAAGSGTTGAATADGSTDGSTATAPTDGTTTTSTDGSTPAAGTTTPAATGATPTTTNGSTDTGTAPTPGATS